jgi:SAM-dependent methyltransferase
MSNRISRGIIKFIPRRIKGILRSLIIPRLEHLPNSPELFRNYYHLFKHPDLERKEGGWVYQGKFYPDYLTIGGASHAIFSKARLLCQGYGIDIGAGFWPLPESIPVDIHRGPGLSKTVSDFEDGSLDYVFSSHCLEHIEKWEEELNKWIRKIKPSGIIFLYLPHPDCAIWLPGSPFVGDGHKWIPTPEIIKNALEDSLCRIEQFDDGPDAMQSFYVCGRKKLQ